MMKWLLAVFLSLVLAAALVFYFFFYHSGLSADYVDAKYSSPESRFFVLQSGARLHYRDEGRQKGLPLVLLHGSSASLHTFEPWVASLGDEYRIITLDLPGHGLTGAVPDADYSMEAFIRSLDQLMVHLGVERFVLGGNSMGGALTWRYTREYPHKVMAMLLINASGYFGGTAREPEDEEEESVAAFSLLRQPWFRAIASHLDTWHLTRQGVQAAYNYSDVADDDLIRRYYELSLREGTRQATVQRFAGFDPTNQMQVPVNFMQPTLIMWGREDSLIDVSVARQFKGAIPHAEVVVYDGVGHVPMEEIPGRSAGDIREFLMSLDNRH